MEFVQISLRNAVQYSVTLSALNNICHLWPSLLTAARADMAGTLQVPTM